MKHMNPGATVVLAMVLAVLSTGVCCAESVSLPIRIEYPFLGSLVAASSFTDPGPSAMVVDEEGGCRQVTISEPTFGEENGRVRFEVRVRVHTGVRVGNACAMAVDWEGYLVLFQDPVIEAETWRLHFDTRDSHLLDLERKPARLAGVVWDLIKKRVYTHLNRIGVDLSLPVGELSAFIQPLVDPGQRTFAERMVESLHLGAVGVAPEAIVIPVLLDLEEAPGEPPPGAGDVVLDSRQKQHLLETWQTWDEFLVSMITALAQKPLTETDRQVLFEVLLEARYGLMEVLEAPAGRTDFVRRQFIDAWRRLSPVFRAHLREGPTRSLLGYLAFFSASDALAALDRIGPTLGIEISRDGLLRLIRLLAEGRYAALEYRPEVNASLRQTLGVGPPLDITAPDDDEGDTGIRGGDRSAVLARCFFTLGRRLQHGLVPSAWAAEAQAVPERSAIEAWIPDPEHFNSYLSRVRGLLRKSIQDAFAASDLNAYFRDLCLGIAPAIAWQESCMRQFETKDGQVVYLRSYNGTSVGIMQINERVWRGIYDREALRWNIAYNARAGCEIVTLYLQRFFMPRAAKENPELLLDEDLTARTLHAMYNGGPGEFSRFLERHRRQRYYPSDRLFYEKYRWVTTGLWDNLRRCWGG